MNIQTHLWQGTLLRSSLIATAILLLCNMGSTALVRANDCRPGADEVALFRNENYNGPCLMMGIGEHRVVQNSNSGPRSVQDVRRQDLPGFASVRVGANVEALAYAEPNLNGNNALIYRDTANLSGSDIRAVSSVIVRRKDQPPKCRPDANQVAHWFRPYFFGDCWTHAVEYVEPGKIGIGSLRVGANVEALLCDDFLFAGTCVVMLPGYYSHWSFPRSTNHSASMTVRLKGQPPCMPGVNQISAYQYEHYAGPCVVFNKGYHSLNEALSWIARVPNWETVARSFRVGENVQASFCWKSGTDESSGPRVCARPLSIDVPSGFRALRRAEQVSLTVQQREATPPAGDRRSGNAPPSVSAHDFTVMLAAHVPFGAGRGEPNEYPWWTGRYPTIGTLNGNLSRVANPRNSVWLGFLKPGRGSYDCGNPSAYVRLDPGETMTEDQMRTIFGSSRPALWVQFLVCSGATGNAAADGRLTFRSLPLNITYTQGP